MVSAMDFNLVYPDEKKYPEYKTKIENFERNYLKMQSINEKKETSVEEMITLLFLKIKYMVSQPDIEPQILLDSYADQIEQEFIQVHEDLGIPFVDEEEDEEPYIEPRLCSKCLCDITLTPETHTKCYACYRS